MKTVFVIGSIMTDMVIKAPYFPKPGESLKGEEFYTAHGGKGANQAVCIARMGGNVKFCGAVGDDANGKASIDSLKDESIDISNIHIYKKSSGVAFITVAENTNSIVVNNGANDCLTIKDVDEFLKNANKDDILLAQLEIPLDTVGYALKKAKKIGMVVVLNPAPMNINIKKYLKYVDMIIPNETETEIFGGIEELNKYVPVVIETLGGDGYRIFTTTSDKQYPCIKVKVADTIGAGDTFCGAFVTSLAENRSLEDACKVASIAASISCTKYGAQPSIPYRRDIKKYL